MGDFHFISDLDIKPESTLFEEQTEQVLRNNESKLSNEIKAIKLQMLELSKVIESKTEELQQIHDKLVEYESPHKEIELNSPTITKEASLLEKAESLFDLFHARRDVCAGRWYNRKTQTKSYSPRCLNSLHPNCPRNQFYRNGRKGIKPDCSECSIKLYEQLTPQLIINKQLLNKNEHGHDAIGLYVMLPGNVCRFMAMDFDEKTWKQDALTVSDIVRNAGFQIAIERSYSGDGAHLWLFFSEDVPAWKARKLAFSFLDKACEISKTVSLKSYDRVFPSQDKIEKDGLGNLILMPLLLSAASRPEPKGTVFVDNDFNTFADQLAFLSSLPKYSNQDIDLYLLQTSNEKNNWFGINTEDEVDVLWNRKLPKVTDKEVISKPLPVFLSAGISIPKAAMSAKLQNALKRMACFPNPEYYKSMNRNKGYAPQNIHSMVQTFIESDTVLQLPRGLIVQLEKYLTESGIEYELTDKRTKDTRLEVKFNGTMRTEQVPAVDELLKHNIGILRAATSYGKTAVAAKIIAERKEKTLILVPKNDLLTQWEKSLKSFLTILNPPVKREGKRVNKTGIGLLGGSKDSACGYIDIATFQTIASRMPETIKEYGMVIVDECHHVAADSFEKVMQAVKPHYVYGLSATVKRDDGLEKVVYSQCGNIVFEYNASQLAYERGISQSVVARLSNSTVSNISGRSFNFSNVINELSQDDNRNNLIISDTSNLVKMGRRVLILTNRVDHTIVLKKKLDEMKISAVAITGQTSKSDMNEAQAKISGEMKNCSVIVSTGKFLGEGTDIPALDTLMIATPISWEGTLSQYAGRIAREYEGKTETFIYDYVDICVPQLERMFHKRLTTYRKLGYVMRDALTDNSSPVEQTGLFSGKSLYSQSDILSPLITAIRNAKHRIIISSPEIFISNSTKQIIEQLKKSHERGINVSIQTHSLEGAINPEAQKESLKYISSKSLNTVLADNCNLRFAVIDESEVWFGDMNILGGAINKMSNEKEQKVMMHVFSSEAASALENSQLGLL